MKVSLVTVTHDRKAYLLDLLRSVYAGSVVPDEVIVVDNASVDGTLDAVARQYPHAFLIRNQENRLVSAAFNAGLRNATGDFVIAIADDNVLAPNCIEELVQCGIRHPEAAVIAPSMYYFDRPQSLWFQGLTTNLTTGHTSFRSRPCDSGSDVIPTDSAPNCLMIARRALETVGYFDELAFPMHHEEADYSLRCRRHGMSTYVSARASEWHRVPLPKWRYGSGDYNVDNPQRAFLNARSRVFLAKRHGTTAQRIIYLTLFMPLFTLAYTAICVAAGGRHGLSVALAFLRGTMQGIIEPVPECGIPAVAAPEPQPNIAARSH